MDNFLNGSCHDLFIFVMFEVLIFNIINVMGAMISFFAVLHITFISSYY